MLKYYDTAITFAEFPDEVALCVNITGCPGKCMSCSEPWLRKNIGTELTKEEVDRLIKENPGITLFGIMGGDRDHNYCIAIASYIHIFHPGIKVGMYSGEDYIDFNLARALDCYKIGRFIVPEGEQKDWYKKNCGPLQFPFSNQIYFEIRDHKMYDCTYKFRQTPLNDLSKYIIK